MGNKLDWTLIGLLIIVSLTILVFILRILTKDMNNKFAYFISRLWCEWFEEQFNAIIAFVGVLLLFLLLGLVFN